MGVYKYIRKLWQSPKKNLGEQYKEHLIEWRREPTTLRVHRPTRLDKARALGYRAKPGIIIVRQRAARGGRMRNNDMGGRRSKHSRLKQIIDKNYQQVCEERANRQFPNLEVLGSYFLAKDGLFYWYEIILVDPEHPAIKSDKQLSWLSSGKHTSRAMRGLTSAGRRSRGLYNKGKGAEKLRPSRNANLSRRGKI